MAGNFPAAATVVTPAMDSVVTPAAADGDSSMLENSFTSGDFPAAGITPAAENSAAIDSVVSPAADEGVFGVALGDSDAPVVAPTAEKSTSIGAARASKFSRFSGAAPAAGKSSYFASDNFFVPGTAHASGISFVLDDPSAAENPPAPDNPTVQRAIPEPLEVHTYFYHQDHLGSAAITTDENGQIVELVDYDPFGVNTIYQKPQGDVYTGKYFYTGQEWDTWTRLYYYGARYYFNEIGKFYSVDPAGFWLGNEGLLRQKTGMGLAGFLSDPQGLNSYSYVKNNPVRYVDPSGEAAVIGGILIVAYALFEVSCTGFDVYETVETFQDPESTEIDQMISLTGTAMGTYGFGGGYATYAKYKYKKEIAEYAARQAAKNVDEVVGVGKIWTKGQFNDSIENAYSHWKKHGHEFPEIQNVNQYVEKAHDFLNNPPKGSLQKVMSDGDIKIYDPKTNIFGVKDKFSTPRTMFKPEEGIEYWNRQ